jgi:hypothetical protein
MWLPELLQKENSMDEKLAIVLISALKGVLVRVIDLIAEIESGTGLKVVTKEELETLYSEAMRKREWQ